MDILIIPDAHAHPKYDNKRFTELGKFIDQTNPDHVVCLGDWADMAALSSYDKGKLSFEGRRYSKDIAVSIDAQEKMFAECRKPGSKTKFTMLLGNHEDRIDRVVSETPELEGHLSTDDLKYQDYWDTVVPFLSPFSLGGYYMAHYFASGIMGRPVGGKHVASTLLNKTHGSCIIGHNHLFASHCENTAGGRKLWGFSAGCYVHKKFSDKWCANTVHMWDRGVLYLAGVKNGSQESHSWVTATSIEKRAK